LRVYPVGRTNATADLEQPSFCIFSISLGRTLSEFEVLSMIKISSLM
jgi:hypothetical protein